MSETLPPLRALLTFEAAARLGSFSKAARHLNVTTSAVSKQVAALERHLGEPLFLRSHKSVELTDRGRRYAHVIGRGVSQLSGDLRALGAAVTDTLNVVVDSDFALLWLLPRLPDLQRQHPSLQVRLHSRLGVSAEDLHAYDAALIWRQGDWLDFVFEPLFTNLVFPVCAPSLLETVGAEDFGSRLSAPLLINDRDPEWWVKILRVLQVGDVDPAISRTFDQTVLCLEAAAAGHGITVGDEVTTRPYLESGRLVIPFDVQLPSPYAYYLVTTGKSESNGALPLFRRWLFSAAREHRRWCAVFWRRRQRHRERAGTAGAAR